MDFFFFNKIWAKVCWMGIIGGKLYTMTTWPREVWNLPNLSETLTITLSKLVKVHFHTKSEIAKALSSLIVWCFVSLLMSGRPLTLAVSVLTLTEQPSSSSCTHCCAQSLTVHARFTTGHCHGCPGSKYALSKFHTRLSCHALLQWGHQKALSEDFLVSCWWSNIPFLAGRIWELNWWTSV